MELKYRDFFLLALLILAQAPEYLGQDIFDASRNGNIKRIKELTRINPDTVNSRNENGFTPLIIAGYRNQLGAVKYLLQRGARVNDNSPEGPVLLGACYKGNLILAELLLSQNAQTNLQNEQGTSALMFAIMANNTELVKLLLKNGADKNLKEKSGKTAQSYAELNGSVEIIALLKQ